jgi:CelD/BcsL family acetyltransferase involved in cellulose biosynthesis
VNGRVVRGSDVEPLEGAWRELWLRSADAHYFSHPDWLMPWWATLGRGTEPYMAVVETDNDLRGVAALARRETALGAFLRPAGEGVSDYTDWLLPDAETARIEVLEQLVDLIAARPDWIGLELAGWKNEADARTLVGQLERRGFIARLLPGLACPYVSMSDGFAAYYRTRGSQARYNVRSRERRLRQHGSVHYEHVTAETAPRTLEDAIALHARRWQGQRTSTVFSSHNLGRAFYRASIPHAIRDGFGDLAVLRVNDRMIASAIGFQRADEYAYYLPAWHPGYHPYAPSTLLLVHLMEYAADHGAARFDFMLGDESYKSSWATGQDRVHTLIAARPDPRGRTWLLRMRAYHALKDSVRSSPRLMSVRRHGLSAIRGWISQGK